MSLYRVKDSKEVQDLENNKWIMILKRVRIPVWLRRTGIIVLVLLLILSGLVAIQHYYDHQILDVQYTQSRPHAYTGSFADKPEELVEFSDVIYEGIVIDISFEAEKPDWRPIYYLNTIYTIAVIRTYKGNTNLIETIHVSNGLQDYKLQEQLDALHAVGAPATYKQINISGRNCTPQIGSTYLFCVKERDDLQERWARYSSQFALSGDLAVPQYDLYNPNVIKEHLPYVPHPLLILTIVSGTVLALTIVIHKRKKQRR